MSDVVDTKSLNPATSAIMAGLSALQDSVDNLAMILQRRENISPGLYRITPDGSAMGRGLGATSHRIRVTHWIISVGAAGTFGVQVGSETIAQVEFAAADTLVIPLPVGIDNGKDISTTGTVADIVDSFLLGYSE